MHFATRVRTWRVARLYSVLYTHTDINALSAIQTHDPTVRASEDSSCLIPRGHCVRLISLIRQ
jgi:hypothetical protein